MKKIFVLSLGGSIIVREKIDTAFLNKFVSFLKKRKEKFVIVVGGGNIARMYIKAATVKARASEKEKDIIGIAATRLNAQLLATLLSTKVCKSIEEACKLAKKKKIVVAAGMFPGTTTDGIAAIIASKLKANFINITNVAGLYTKNPKYKNAKLIKKISYKNFLKKCKKHKAGEHFVLDRIAAEIIKKHKIKTIIVGKNINNLRKIIKGKQFFGTIIS